MSRLDGWTDLVGATRLIPSIVASLLEHLRSDDTRTIASVRIQPRKSVSDLSCIPAPPKYLSSSYHP